jgi:hypothetical protein
MAQEIRIADEKFNVNEDKMHKNCALHTLDLQQTLLSGHYNFNYPLIYSELLDYFEIPCKKNGK